MRYPTISFAVAVVALALSTRYDGVRSGEFVNPVVIDNWLKLAKEIRDLGFCLYDPNDPALSLNRSVQINFATGVNDETIAQRTSELEGTVKLCTFCRTYAQAAVSASADNILFNCGFTGDLWNTSFAYHFNGCMTAVHSSSGGNFSLAGVAGVSSGFDTFEELRDKYFNPDTGARTQAIAECKLTHQRRDCVSCHNSQASTASAVSNSGSALRNTIQQLPRRPKLNDVVVADPCKSGVRATSPCKQPTSKVIDPGLLESDQGAARQGPGATGAPSSGSGAPAASPSPLYRSH